MTKVLFLIGSHCRHKYLIKELIPFSSDALTLVLKRENTTPEVPYGLNIEEKKLFEKHFLIRNQVEIEKFGIQKDYEELLRNTSSIDISDKNDFNSFSVMNKVRAFKADLCIVFGTYLIKQPLLDILPNFTVNIHLGLSPWYRGDATLFWPFYMLQPQECGITIHKLGVTADSGPIIHQARPNFFNGDRLHDVGARCVILAANELKKIIAHIKNNHKFKEKKQSFRGKEWRASDFTASHLKVNYDNYHDQMVDWMLGKKNITYNKIVSQF